MRSNIIDLELELVTTTEKAIKVSDGKNEVWLPKSLIEIEDAGGGLVTVTLPQRLAYEKGLL